MNPNRPTDSLSRTLAAWRVEPPRDPAFRAVVWARLGAAAAGQPWSWYVRRHAAAVGGALVLAVVAGALSGHERARSQVAADTARLAAAYVAELDARVMPPR